MSDDYLPHGGITTLALSNTFPDRFRTAVSPGTHRYIVETAAQRKLVRFRNAWGPEKGTGRTKHSGKKDTCLPAEECTRCQLQEMNYPIAPVCRSISPRSR